MAYAQACESALGLWPQADVRRARTLLLELERLYNHLNDIAAICAGVGFAPGNMLFAALKERAQRLNTQLAGHRFLFDTVAVGRSDLHVDDQVARAARLELAELQDEFGRGWRELQFAGSLQERLHGVGAVSAADAAAPGRRRSRGPRHRAGRRRALRRAAAVVPRVPAGDDRAGRRRRRRAPAGARRGAAGDLRAAARPCWDGRSSRRRPARYRPANRLGVATVESPRGQTLCAVELDAGTIARLHLRTGSYANWPLLTLAVRDDLLPDFPLINKSFELCYACVDR